MIHHHHQNSTHPPLESLGPLDHEPPPVDSTGEMIGRVRLCDILAFDGVASVSYSKAVEALSDSLTRHNAAIIQLNTEDSAVLRCGLESARFFFRTRARNQCVGGVYVYRPGRYAVLLFFFSCVI